MKTVCEKADAYKAQITLEAYSALTSCKPIVWPTEIEGDMVGVWLYSSFIDKMRQIKRGEESLSDVILRFLREEAVVVSFRPPMTIEI